MQVPLCYVLQAIGFHYVIVGVCLDPQHVAGVRNEWADDLSRNCLEGFEQGCGNPWPVEGLINSSTLGRWAS